METIKSWYHRIDVQVDRLIRQYKRKKFLLKAKVFLLFVLPVLILLIGVKAAKPGCGSRSAALPQHPHPRSFFRFIRRPCQTSM